MKQHDKVNSMLKLNYLLSKIMIRIIDDIFPLTIGDYNQKDSTDWPEPCLVLVLRLKYTRLSFLCQSKTCIKFGTLVGLVLCLIFFGI